MQQVIKSRKSNQGYNNIYNPDNYVIDQNNTIVAHKLENISNTKFNFIGFDSDDKLFKTELKYDSTSKNYSKQFHC